MGIFDSRAVALAYYRSASFQQQTQALKAEHARAKALGDTERMKALEAQALAKQDLAHKQSFSTWPVDDLLAEVQDELPKIAATNRVDVILSKWRIVYQRPNLTFIDITRDLIQHWNPDTETIALVDQLTLIAPTSLAELTDSHHNCDPKGDQQ